METEMKQPARTSRVLEIELMKAVAVISMVFVHVLEMSDALNVMSVYQQTAEFIIELFGGILSAGVFMSAMGWGAACSKRATVQTYVRRCFSLFLLGLVINVFEEYLPALLVPDRYGPLSEVLPSILAVDIYFFAALMSLYFALMKKLESRPRLAAGASILLIIVCALANIFLGFETFSTGNEWLDTILGLFIRVNEYSYFPFVSWCIFPVLGFWLARAYRKAGMKRSVIFAAVSGIAAILLSEFLLSRLHMPDAAITDVVEVDEAVYYALHPLYVINGYGMIALEFVIAHIVLLISRNRLYPVLRNLSANVSQIYLMQWLVIGLLSPVLARISSVWANILMGMFVLAASYIGGNLLKKTGLIRV